MSVATLRNDLVVLVRDQFHKYTLSEMSVTRGKELLATITPYYQEDLLDKQYLSMRIKALRDNPAILFEGCDIIDGVVYPQGRDEEEYQALMAEFREILVDNPEMAANVAALSMWTAEGLEFDHAA